MRSRILQSLSIALLAAGGISAAVAQGSGSWIDPPPQPPAPAEPQGAGAAPPTPRAAPDEPRASTRSRAEPRRTEPPLRQAAEPRAREPVEKPRQTAEPPRRAAPMRAPATAERPAPEQRTAEGRGQPSRPAAAEALAAAYLRTWSAPGDLTLESTTDFYAPRVRFHGRMMSARELLEEKRRFVRRWPERDYRPRLNTMGTACSSRSATCTVRSVFDFSAANPSAGRRSHGIGTLELVVSFTGDRAVITEESSVVLGRGRGEQRAALEEAGR
jgi:hypothetical protein